MDTQNLLILIVFYSTLLFAIAWLAERHGHRITASWWRPAVYTLSIGVYCSSWTFLGAVGEAVDNGWHFLPIYLGPILLIVFGWKFIRRLLTVSSKNKITSVADFIGSRYGKKQSLAAIVTLVLVVGTLPYIALQLRGVSIAWSTINWQSIGDINVNQGSSVLAAMIMGWFAIVFGTRVMDGPNQLKGMVTAVAVESLVKLIAFVVVAYLAWSILPNAYPLFNDVVSSSSTSDLTGAAFQLQQPNFSTDQFFTPLFLTEMLLAATAIICLPRQFHVMVVEYQDKKDIRYFRWLFPIYLGLFAVLAIPLAYTGAELFSDLGIATDSYILSLPKLSAETNITALTFLGAISAATGMVIVATIALSIMISNELIVPFWLRLNSRQPNSTNLSVMIRYIRRISILLILTLAWALEQVMSNKEGLASLGLISFAACAQIFPAIFAALYWRRGHSDGVTAGVIVGIAIWFYTLMLPIVLPPDHSLVSAGPFEVSWLAPQSLFGLGWLDPLSHGVFWSFLLNSITFYLVSRKSVFTNLDLRQAESFLQSAGAHKLKKLDMDPSGIEVRQLQSLIEPLFGPERCQKIWQEYEKKVGHRLLPYDQAPKFTVSGIESDLAAFIGAVSARRAMELLASQQPLLLQDFVSFVSGSSKQIQFSQTLLQTTLETIPQGISVVDKDLKLVAWNRQYQQLFDYPQRFLYVGCDISSVYYYNAVRGFIGEDNQSVDEMVQRRLNHLSSGKSYRLERVLPSGTVIEIRGTPLKNGGYVTTYTDISDHHQMLNELESAKENLEERVDNRTQELRSVNFSLQRENELRSRIEKELQDTNESKNRFMAAASHDLLQPINASRLFVSSLSKQVEPLDNSELIKTVKHLDDALSQSEQLIGSLREIALLGSGREQTNRTHFPLASLFTPLASESKIIAEKQGLEFKWVPTSCWVYSDQQLLRRVLQNFISNGIRYTKKGKILMGARQLKNAVAIEIWDTGIGISQEDQERIFDDFERLPGSKGQGLGLGLSISSRIAQLLGHPINLNSTVGKGSVFKIIIPKGEPQKIEMQKRNVDPNLAKLNVLCIDNEPLILSGMQSLLEQWGCQVTTAVDLNQALNNWSHKHSPDLILADYHLDHDTGLDVVEALRLHWNRYIPGILISADNSETIKAKAQQAKCLYIAKPVPANGLRNLMNRAIRMGKKVLREMENID